MNSTPSMIVRELYYVDFEKGEKTGFFLDNSNYLKGLYNSIRFNQKINHTPEEETKLCLEKTKGYIRSVKPSIMYYTYVKILKDEQNPQLEGQILIFKFGRKIKDIIQDFFVNKGMNQVFDNTFSLIVSSLWCFSNFDECHFTDKKINIVDNTLDLNAEISFPVLNILAIQRREKLLQLTTNTEIDYEEILNGIPLEEIEKYLEKIKTIF